MTPEQRLLVQESCAQVVPIADIAAELFYARLFELDPSLRGLFHGNVREQGRKLMPVRREGVMCTSLQGHSFARRSLSIGLLSGPSLPQVRVPAATPFRPVTGAVVAGRSYEIAVTDSRAGIPAEV
jgi:hypothetical protein